MAQHTTGPWDVATGHGWNYAMVGPADADHYVAAVYGLTKDESNDREVQEANARLIAAAPDLLAALTELQDALASMTKMAYSGPQGTTRQFGEARKAAAAAIAKATGVV
jgi:hypothetical protein